MEIDKNFIILVEMLICFLIIFCCTYLITRPMTKRYASVNSINVLSLYEKEAQSDWTMTILSQIYIKNSTYSKIEFLALKDVLISSGEYKNDKNVVEISKDITLLKNTTEEFKSILAAQVHHLYKQRKRQISSITMSVLFIGLIIIFTVV